MTESPLSHVLDACMLSVFEMTSGEHSKSLTIRVTLFSKDGRIDVS